MLPSLILSRFFWLSTKLQWYFLFCEIPWHLRMFTFYKILNDPKWRKKIASSAPRCSFFACLHILCPLRNAITPPKTMSLKSSGWTLTLKQGMCGVGSSIDFPKPKLQGLNYYGWGLRCVDHSKTITVKDQECLKQKNDLSISESCRRTALTNGSQLSWPNTNNPRRRKGQKKRKNICWGMGTIE